MRFTVLWRLARRLALVSLGRRWGSCGQRVRGRGEAGRGESRQRGVKGGGEREPRRRFLGRRRGGGHARGSEGSEGAGGVQCNLQGARGAGSQPEEVGADTCLPVGTSPSGTSRR